MVKRLWPSDIEDSVDNFCFVAVCGVCGFNLAFGN